jgi:hypothetical protein
MEGARTQNVRKVLGWSQEELCVPGAMTQLSFIRNDVSVSRRIWERLSVCKIRYDQDHKPYQMRN